jgi:hypothetical protein
MNITAKHRSRWLRFHFVGCVACRKDGRVNTGTQVHHLNAGGKAGQKRRGNDFTIPLCPWHHQGVVPWSHWTSKEATEWMGPSLAKQSKAFRERYGTDDDLLAYTNALITESFGF